MVMLNNNLWIKRNIPPLLYAEIWQIYVFPIKWRINGRNHKLLDKIPFRIIHEPPSANHLNHSCGNELLQCLETIFKIYSIFLPTYEPSRSFCINEIANISCHHWSNLKYESWEMDVSISSELRNCTKSHVHDKCLCLLTVRQAPYFFRFLKL